MTKHNRFIEHTHLITFPILTQFNFHLAFGAFALLLTSCNAKMIELVIN